jgi:hypothetical protein
MKLVMNFSKKKKKLASIQEGLFVALYAEVQTRAAEGCTTKGIRLRSSLAQADLIAQR